MLQVCRCNNELQAIDINIRQDTGIADVWLNKDIKQINTIDENNESNTEWVSQQAYFQVKNSVSLEAELMSNFDAYFEEASQWKPTDSEILATASEVKQLSIKIENVEDCILEMSEVIYDV